MIVFTEINKLIWFGKENTVYKNKFNMRLLKTIHGKKSDIELKHFFSTIVYWLL